ncbi:MBL fold metallo-hydrolase [Jatrophihabitans endophyticus]|uniref:MBL fold metallo-hydrolase n=1 Tax=Jatrophihabitans endophyticus TaxID=1206085 RepID=UPI001A0BEB33|nr:MBL fold metallo-hydrolase [Jatrophihabitans endophyticus]MBE7190334.1 MBL fold metallo-hydrolase [Jatrophihabitans endophyticus]
MPHPSHVHQIGAVRVTRVEEIVTDEFSPRDLIPRWDPAVAAEHADWMVPVCLDAAGEHVVVSVHSWLVEAAGRTILVDTGIGNGKPRRAPLFDDLDQPYLDRLAACGVRPDDVDLVLMTHLHTDHVGWNTRKRDGAWVPTFPNARHVMPKREQAFRDGLLRTRGPDQPQTAFYADSVVPVLDRTDLVEDGDRVLDLFRFVATPGHSVGHMSIALESEGQTAFFAGDVMHHPVQVVRPDWSSIFSEDPALGEASRRRALEHAADTDATVFSSHFPGSSAGRISRHGDGFRWQFL